MKMIINSTGLKVHGGSLKQFQAAMKLMARPHKGPLQPGNDTEAELKRLLQPK
jgi:hypothetical protein